MPTRPTSSWSDLAGRTVGLWGLGVEGAANLRKLISMGITPVLVDDAPDPARPAPGGRRVLRTDDGGLDALARCEVVVKSPGISRYRPEVRRLLDAGVEVAGGMGLWLQEADLARVIAVTGTKGKSTTAAIAAHLLGGLGGRAALGGNIGRLPYDPEGPADVEWWVVEISSFQATDLASSPHVVVVTSLHPDHLDWHGDTATYYADKLSVCTQPGARITVADGDSALVRAHASQLGPEIVWVTEDGEWTAALGLPGAHNARNASLARAALVAAGVPGADDDAAVLAAATGFEGLDSRLKTIGTVDGVEFVDDGLSTNVLPTLVALDALAPAPDATPDATPDAAPRRIALICGGFDRGIDYAPLAEGLAPRAGSCALFTLPPSGARIHAALDAGPHPAPAVTDCADLDEAVDAAFAWARPGGMVLLSPAAPSFGAFADYKARSAAFAGAMRRCSTGPAAP